MLKKQVGYLRYTLMHTPMYSNACQTGSERPARCVQQKSRQLLHQVTNMATLFGIKGLVHCSLCCQVVAASAVNLSKGEAMVPECEALEQACQKRTMPTARLEHSSLCSQLVDAYHQEHHQQLCQPRQHWLGPQSTAPAQQRHQPQRLAGGACHRQEGRGGAGPSNLLERPLSTSAQYTTAHLRNTQQVWFDTKHGSRLQLHKHTKLRPYDGSA